MRCTNKTAWLVVLVAAFLLTFSATPAAAVVDTFNVRVTDSDLADGVTGDCTGYLGAWYPYPSGWWNQWFYNGDWDENRWKEIDIDMTVRTLDPGSDSYAHVIVGNASWAWSQQGFDRPPLPEDCPTIDLEELYIDRTVVLDPVFEGEVLEPKDIRFSTVILDYNPEWVFIDVRGVNFEIIGGVIDHRCVPEPAMVSLLLIGSLMLGVVAVIRRKR